MLDIKFIREHVKEVKDNIKKKSQDDKVKLVDDVLKKDGQHLKLLQQEQEIRTKRNRVHAEINALKKQGKDIKQVLKDAKKLPGELKKVEEKRIALANEIGEILLTIPNMMHKSVPKGKDDTENVVREKIGKPKKFSFDVKSHGELAEELDIVDFDASAAVAGNGFYYLKGDLVLLNQALQQYGLNFMIQKGYIPVEPPLMINKRATQGVVDFETFRDMIYKIEEEDLYLIATSEHPLISMFVDKILEENQLPIKFVGISPCFRKEVGSHGLDERGLYRTHQFNKIEMIVICKPEESYDYYDELLGLSKELFKSLGLPSRVYESCSGDLGDLKAKGADLEAWSPRKKDYFEVCSCSNLTEAQSRRLNIRVRKGGEKYYPHTLNNTAIATSRAMVAILENFQNKDGSVDIPKVLQPFMGKKKIEKR
jgi:seryl-tRNA synthetase